MTARLGVEDQRIGHAQHDNRAKHDADKQQIVAQRVPEPAIVKQLDVVGQPDPANGVKADVIPLGKARNQGDQRRSHPEHGVKGEGRQQQPDMEMGPTEAAHSTSPMDEGRSGRASGRLP